MSLHALLMDVRRPNLRDYRIPIAILALIMVLGLMTGLFRRNTTGSADPKEATLQSLIELQYEAAGMKNELSARLAISKDPVERNASAGGSQARSSSVRNGIPLVGYQPGEAFTEIRSTASDVYIPTGAVFQAQMLTPIKTSIQESFVMARTTREFRMDSNRRIERDSRLIGGARLNPVLKGVMVQFRTLVDPKGIEHPISSLALSKDVFPELEGLYFSNKLETYSTALAFGFLSGFSEASQTREPSLLYGSVPKRTLDNQLLSGVSRASFQIAEDILRDIRERAVEYVVIPAGERVFIALDNRYYVEAKK